MIVWRDFLILERQVFYAIGIVSISIPAKPAS
jgi:hypothetical protein